MLLEGSVIMASAQAFDISFVDKTFDPCYSFFYGGVFVLSLPKLEKLWFQIRKCV